MPRLATVPPASSGRKRTEDAAGKAVPIGAFQCDQTMASVADDIGKTRINPGYSLIGRLKGLAEPRGIMRTVERSSLLEESGIICIRKNYLSCCRRRRHGSIAKRFSNGPGPPPKRYRRHSAGANPPPLHVPTRNGGTTRSAINKSDKLGEETCTGLGQFCLHPRQHWR